MTPRFRVQRALGLMLIAQTLVAQPAPEREESAGAADGREAEDTSTPASLQLFEFLGEFTTEDGEWVDPALLLEADLTGAVRTELGVTRGGEEATPADIDIGINREE